MWSMQYCMNCTQWAATEQGDSEAYCGHSYHHLEPKPVPWQCGSQHDRQIKGFLERKDQHTGVVQKLPAWAVQSGTAGA